MSQRATGLSIADLDEFPGDGRNRLGQDRHGVTGCTGEITYTGHGVLPTDIANFRTALAAAAGGHTGSDAESGVEPFLNAASPGVIAL
jgi:5-methyltetrahydropteroyltriglutamate--homocysteine methyltransferase